MKRSTKIILIVFLTLMLAMMLVACGNNSEENFIGTYYKVDKKDGVIEILTVDSDGFTLVSFSPENFDLLPDDYSEISTVYSAEIANSAQTYKGTYTYTDNVLIEKRLNLKYTDGKSGSTYAYLSDNTFVFSPKMGMILIYALLGFCITLVVLCLLMGIIKLLGFSVDKISGKFKKKSESKQTDAIEEQKSEIKLAKGSAGDLKLENVSDRDAAMIMAIVADELNEPLNSLRFISIKDVTDEEVKK